MILGDLFSSLLSSSGLVAAIAAGVTAILIKGLEIWHNRRKDAATLDGRVQVSAIEDARALRGDMMAQIRDLWERQGKLEETIASLRSEIMHCEARHIQLSRKHNRLVDEMRRRVPDFEIDTLDDELEP